MSVFSHTEYRVEFRHKPGPGRWSAVDTAVNRTYRDRAEAEQLAAGLRTAHGELIECRVVSRRVTDWEPVEES